MYVVDANAKKMILVLFKNEISKVVNIRLFYLKFMRATLLKYISNTNCKLTFEKSIWFYRYSYRCSCVSMYLGLQLNVYLVNT